MSKHLTIGLILLITAPLFVCGCHRKKLPDGMPELLPLTLNVTYGSKPAEGVDLTFHSNTVSYAVSGRTDADGKAQIVTNGEYKGVPAGDYKVTASKYEDTPSKYGPMPTGSREVVEEWIMKVHEEDPPSYLRVNPEFLDPETTPIEINVAKGTKTAAVDLGEEAEIRVERTTRAIREE